MTGAEIKREFDREIFKAYSTFYNPVKQNDLLRKALIVSLEDRYKNLIQQKDFDDMSSVIKVNKVFELNNNKIYTAPLDIVSIAKFGTNFIVFCSKPHNINIGDSVTLANVQGFTPTAFINNIFTVTNFFFSTTQFSFTLNATTGVHVANTGQVVKHDLNGVDKMANDYNHLLAVKAKFEQLLPYEVSNITNTQPISIVLSTINNNIVSKEQLTISGAVSNTNANGTFYVKKINRKTFSLFLDKDLTSSTLGNGDYQGLVLLKRLFYNFCVPLISTEKISNYDDATLVNPAFERGDKMIKIAPYEFECTEITMDYVTNAVVFIDVNDSVIDLSDTYPNEFIYYVISKAVQLFAQEVNDPEKYKSATTEQQQNK